MVASGINNPNHRSEATTAARLNPLASPSRDVSAFASGAYKEQAREAGTPHEPLQGRKLAYGFGLSASIPAWAT